MLRLIQTLLNSPMNGVYVPQLGIGLDVCYVSSRILVCGAPVTKYRNCVKELHTYLQFQHEDNWWMWNLQRESSGYNDKEFFHRVNHFPFPDHYPPSLRTMINCVFQMKSWLEQSPTNVVCIHCNAGKGRSGTIGCALMMVMDNISPETAMAKFTEKRMKRFSGSGVSIISQTRYLNYWAKLLHNPEIKPGFGTCLTRFQWRSFDIIGPRCLFQLKLKFYKHNCNGDQILNHSENFEHSFELENEKRISGEQTTKVLLFLKYDDLVIYCGNVYACFNIGFEVTDSNTIVIKWTEFDGYNGTRLKGYKLFDEIHLKFVEVQPSK